MAFDGPSLQVGRQIKLRTSPMYVFRNQSPCHYPYTVSVHNTADYHSIPLRNVDCVSFYESMSLGLRDNRKKYTSNQVLNLGSEPSIKLACGCRGR